MNAALKKMSRADKLRIMEELWSDLTSDEGKFSSPSWHFDELQRTEEDIRAGRTKFIDWEQAKKSIRRLLQNRKPGSACTTGAGLSS